MIEERFEKKKRRKTLKFEGLPADNSTRSPIFEQRESTVGRTHLINIYQRSIFLRWKKKKEKTIQSKKYVYTHIVYIQGKRETSRKSISENVPWIFLLIEQCIATIRVRTGKTRASFSELKAAAAAAALSSTLNYFDRATSGQNICPRRGNSPLFEHRHSLDEFHFHRARRCIIRSFQVSNTYTDGIVQVSHNVGPAISILHDWKRREPEEGNLEKNVIIEYAISEIILKFLQVAYLAIVKGKRGSFLEASSCWKM